MPLYYDFYPFNLRYPTDLPDAIHQTLKCFIRMIAGVSPPVAVWVKTARTHVDAVRIQVHTVTTQRLHTLDPLCPQRLIRVDQAFIPAIGLGHRYSDLIASLLHWQNIARMRFE